MECLIHKAYLFFNFCACSEIFLVPAKAHAHMPSCGPGLDSADRPMPSALLLAHSSRCASSDTGGYLKVNGCTNRPG